MRLYLDDSGDPGLRLGKSSPVLDVGGIVVDDHLGVEDAVRAFRRDAGWREDWEIKFRNTSHKNRTKFLQRIVELPIEAHVLTVVKASIAVPYRTIVPDLYQFAVRRCIEVALDGRYVDLVIIDEIGREKQYKQSVRTGLRQYLRGSGSRGLVGDVAIRDSRHEDILQIADIVAGSVRYMHTEGDAKYRDILRPILRETLWP